MAELAEGARLEIVCTAKSGTEGSNPSLSARTFKVETFEECSILFKFKGYSAEERNWTAARLPDRAIPQDCGRVNAKI